MKIVVLGGCAAGPKAAAKAKRMIPDADIEMYTREDVISYSACGLPYFIEGYFDKIEKLIIRTPEDFEQKGIKVYLNSPCEAIMPAGKTVVINGHSVSFDKLIIAIGARVKLPCIEKINLEGIYKLRSLSDGINIKKEMKKSKRAVIIGGGYIGIEILEAFVKNGIETVVIDETPYILPIFDSEISEIIKKHIVENSSGLASFINSDIVVKFEGDKHIEKVITRKGLEIKTDMCILATGVKPNVEIAKKAGIIIGETGAIKVNKRMQTNFPDIYACGDCAEKYNLIDQTPAWFALGSIANKEARTAAINACGGEDTFEGVQGSAVTRYFGFTMSITGYTEREAKIRGYDVECATVTKYDKAGYMPNAKNITIKLIVNAKNREIIGAQGIGCGDADKRINAVVGAIQENMTIDDFLSVDLTYAPPFSTPIDPLVNAGYIIVNKLNNRSDSTRKK